MEKNKILFISSPVGKLGGGEVGGVESMIRNLVFELDKINYEVMVVAPKGSRLPGLKVKFIQVPGALALNVFGKGKNVKPKINPKGVLENMWAWAAENQHDYSRIVSFSYDALSFNESKIFSIPVFHFIGVTSINKYTDAALKNEFLKNSERFAFMSKVQFQTFKLPKLKANLLSGGVSLKDFPFTKVPEKRLVWSARISPEKNLEFALRVSKKVGMPLDICGVMQNKEYFKKVISKFPRNIYKYHGFLPAKKLAKVLGNAEVALFMPKVTEAFALSTVEAMSCGTPIVTLPDTGPAEIATLTNAGIVSKSKKLNDFITALNQAKKISREQCREAAICFDWSYFADGFVKWIK